MLVKGKRTYKKKVARKVYRKRYPRKAQTSSIVRKGAPVSDRLYTKLKWTTQGTFSIPLWPAFSTLQYKGSLLDCDYLGAGSQQPLWRDQLLTMYKRYRMWGIGYKFTFQTSSVRMIRGCIAEADDQVEATFDGATERRWNRQFFIPPGGSKPITVRGYIPCNRIWGMTKQQWRTSADSQNLLSADLPKTTWLNVYFAGNEITSGDYVVELTLVAELFERVFVTLS